MVHWEVRTADRSTVVTGGNWLAAIGSATDNLGLEPLALARMVCDIQPDGLVQVRDPNSGLMLLVRHLDDNEIEAALARAVPPEAPEVAEEEEPLFIVPPELQAEPTPVVESEGVDLGDEDDDTEVEPLPVPMVDTPEAEEPALTAEEPLPTVDEPLPTVDEPQPLPDPPPAPATFDAEGLTERPVAEPPAATLDDPDDDATIADGDEDADLEDAPASPPPPIEMPKALGHITLEETFNKPIPTVQPSSGFTNDDMAFFSQGTVILDAEDDEAPEDLVEQLFDKCFDISLAKDLYEAAQMALDILSEFVPAESGAVLYASLNHTALEFLTCTGPHADEVREMEVPFGQGIAGTVFDLGVSLIIRDAATDPRHLSEVDERTGYRTGPMLATVVRDDEGTMYGCIELMNPPIAFRDWHLDAAVTVAAALADYVRTRA